MEGVRSEDSLPELIRIVSWALRAWWMGKAGEVFGLTISSLS